MSNYVFTTKAGGRRRLAVALLVTAGTACSAALGSAALAVAPARDTIGVGNPVDGSNGFGVVTEGDALLGSTESEGPVAVGGNLSYGDGYNVSLHTAGTFVAPGDSTPTALLVGGGVDYARSSSVGVLKVLGNGYVKIGDMTGSQVLTTDANGASVNTRVTASGAGYDSTPRVELTTQQPASSVAQSGLMDFTSLFSTYRDRADRMAGCANNVTLLDGNGNPLADQTDIAAGSGVKISLTEGRTNVLRLTGEQLNNIAEITFLNHPSADTPLVIVVDTTGTGGEFTWTTPNLAGVSGTDAPYILWDFPDATDITIASGDTLEGTIYAPRAHLTDLSPSNIEGDIIVKSLTAGPLSDGPTRAAAVNAGEIHYFPFAATIECEDETTPSPGPSESTGEPTPGPSESTGEPTPDPSESTGVPSPGPSESTGEPTPGPSESTGEPTPGPTGSSAGPEPGPSGSTGPRPSPSHSDPALADTGADVPVGTLAGAAAALTGVGAAVLLWTARRRGRHEG
ncbi:collagen-binding domain-containing protein [Streptomyces sp. CC219B]|uniref:collagen-binding domain-containing protein n=1 Tax=Streptomyces sp. CC219B TaxID=3044574 RepID=UPI0024A97B2C|nr:collagen-binding domain-containing protein [Streptomyces sp. CC219B]